MICIVGKKKKASFRFVWDTYLQPSMIDAKCTRKHIQETELHLTRWITFWDELENKEIKVAKCDRKHLETWRRHLIALDKYKPRSINKHLGSIRSILIAADKNGILKRRPKLEQLPDDSIDPARKIYLRNEQIDALMAKTDSLTWPPKSHSGIDPKDWWRCAIVLYRIYGFRPQELLAYDSKKTPITWANITFNIESPNPSSEQKNEFGWLFYTPPKTKRKKPHPLYLPLTRHARAALDRIIATRLKSDSRLFSMPFSQTGFMEQWYAWFRDADVKPKIEGARYKPYCMRKTCATQLSNHRDGLASAVCRWGASQEAKVALDHYIQNESLHDAPMPKSFDEFLSITKG
jgi:hypothetical protein